MELQIVSHEKDVPVATACDSRPSGTVGRLGTDCSPDSGLWSEHAGDSFHQAGKATTDPNWKSGR